MIAAISKMLMNQTMPSRAHKLLAMSRPKLQRCCGTVNRPHNHYNLCLNSPHTAAGLLTVQTWKIIWCVYCMLCGTGTGMQKIQKLELYVIALQGSKEREGGQLYMLVDNTRHGIAP
jgi:hypothetical protein